jgi:hypothetical protein
MATQDLDSPFVKSEAFNKPVSSVEKTTLSSTDDKKDISTSKFDFLVKNKALIVKLVIVLLVILIIYQIYCSCYESDGFLQPSLKTGPEIDSKLDLEGEIALLNNMQETFFGATC